MFRNMVGAVVVMGVCLGLVMAEDIKGRITKISKDSVSVAPYDKETKKLGDTKSYPLAKDVKFFQVKKDAKEAIEGGVKASIFQKIDAKKGLAAVIVVTNNKVTEVRVMAPKKKD